MSKPISKASKRRVQPHHKRSKTTLPQKEQKSAVRRVPVQSKNEPNIALSNKAQALFKPTVNYTQAIIQKSLHTSLSLPARCIQPFHKDVRQLPFARVSRESCLTGVSGSPRANAYLSLEPGLQRYQVEQSIFTCKQMGPYLFLIGGLHSPPEQAAQQLSIFRKASEEAGYKRLLLFPISESEVNSCRQAGFECIQVGAEAFLDPQQFTLSGSKMADLRQMCNRAHKRFHIQIREFDPKTEKLDRIQALYQHWTQTHSNSRKMELLIGTPCLDFPAGRRYFLAESSDQSTPFALLTLTPGWSKQGWGIDVMARDRNAPAGTMELLISKVIQLLASEGITIFSLGASPMAHISKNSFHGAAHLRLIFQYLYRSQIGNALFHFHSLHHFKNKFHPNWKPVYIGGSPNMGVWNLYIGCQMWGLF